MVLQDRLDRVQRNEVCKIGGGGGGDRAVVVMDVLLLLLLLQHASTKPSENHWHRLLATENP